jgi:hypothetical protein
MMARCASGGDNSISCRIAEDTTTGKLPSLTVPVGAATVAVARSGEALPAATTLVPGRAESWEHLGRRSRRLAQVVLQLWRI